MRCIIGILAIAACGQSAPSAPQGSDPGSGSAPGSAQHTPAAAPLTMNGVRLLEPETVIEQRLPDTDRFSRLLKAVVVAIGAFDASHPGALPAQLDAVVVARATGTRVWLVGPGGDLAAPALDVEIAKLRPAPVKERHVAAIVTLVRDGTTPAAANGGLPAAWKTAAGSTGGEIDAVIDKVWPPS
jgi:hypothetical protein